MDREALSVKKHLVRTSKFLSLVLRHAPERIGLSLDDEGWAPVAELLAAARKAGHPITHELLETVVRENDKQRFSLSPDGARIRANQGHSVAIDLGLEPVTPPELLFHGTAERFVESIVARGLIAGQRQHVHLSSDAETAHAVGRRHGRPVVLIVESGVMHAAGHTFFRSANGVWLVRSVPVAFIRPRDRTD